MIISLNETINNPSILLKCFSYSILLKNGFSKSQIYLSLGTPIALRIIVKGINSLKEELLIIRTLFFIKIWIFDLVSKVDEAHEEVKILSFGSISTRILFLQSYSYIRIIFSIPLIMKYPLGSFIHS